MSAVATYLTGFVPDFFKQTESTGVAKTAAVASVGTGVVVTNLSELIMAALYSGGAGTFGGSVGSVGSWIWMAGWGIPAMPAWGPVLAAGVVGGTIIGTGNAAIWCKDKVRAGQDAKRVDEFVARLAGFASKQCQAFQEAEATKQVMQQILDSVDILDAANDKAKKMLGTDNPLKTPVQKQEEAYSLASELEKEIDASRHELKEMLDALPEKHRISTIIYTFTRLTEEEQHEDAGAILSLWKQDSQALFRQIQAMKPKLQSAERLGNQDTIDERKQKLEALEAQLKQRHAALGAGLVGMANVNGIHALEWALKQTQDGIWQMGVDKADEAVITQAKQVEENLQFALEALKTKEAGEELSQEQKDRLVTNLLEKIQVVDDATNK